MRRTTIYLENDQEIRLKLETQRQGRPMADLVREAVTQYLAASPGVQRATAPAWGRFAGGHTDTAERNEELLRETGFGEGPSPAASRRLSRAPRTKRK
jgi:hypothetical protein